MIFQHDSSNKIDCSYHAVHIRPSALFMLCYLQSCGNLASSVDAILNEVSFIVNVTQVFGCQFQHSAKQQDYLLLQSCCKLLSCSGRVTLPNLNLVYIDVCCKIAASKGG
ncbi:hypothetical protein DBP80_15530 [Salmonella enterica subsp. enterica serovar 4,[5],12:i:-]|nr:hypothetical protein DBP80_15530 [Salmonella enterica subsp. enterica serovar 4,[5],12:i:-]